jgi:RimJ/RimL family protein N-acetyltransferase
MVAADAPALAAAANESRDTYLFTTVPDSSDRGEGYVARALEMRSAGTRFPFTLEWNDRVVGSSSYMRYQPWQWPAGAAGQRIDRPDIVEIGYTWLAASAQRTACNSQAKLLMLSQAFDVWQVHAVLLRTDERNTRSRTAIERLGAKFEGILRADMPAFDGAVRNTAQYSIIAEEWPAVRDRLNQRLNETR